MLVSAAEQSRDVFVFAQFGGVEASAVSLPTLRSIPEHDATAFTVIQPHVELHVAGGPQSVVAKQRCCTACPGPLHRGVTVMLEICRSVHQGHFPVAPAL